MSLRRTSNIPGAGVVPTASNGFEAPPPEEGESGSPSKAQPPSKPPRPPGAFAVLVSDSIWFFRNAQGRFWYALGHAQRILRKTVALIINGLAFAFSVGLELLVTSKSDFKNQWLPLVENLTAFLETSGIGDELAKGFSSYRFLSNVAILARIQHTLWEGRYGAKPSFPTVDRRNMVLSSKEASEDANSSLSLSEERKALIISEGQRFMRYATAAYGVSMIDAAEIDVYGSIRTSQLRPSAVAGEAATSLLASLKSSFGDGTNNQRPRLNAQEPPQQNPQPQPLEERSSSFFDEDFIADKISDILLGRMSEHIGIPEEDIYLMNLCDEQVPTLRYFIALDRANKSLVLTIRGTLTAREVLIDIAAFSRPFCGGEAHSEMANTAEKIWDEAGATILKLLGENPGYELVLTGHSLGAGAAGLLNILLRKNDREAVGGRPLRCFSFASPPVFAGGEPSVGEEARSACVNYIHDTDVVPFLSVDSVRRIFAALNAVEESNLSVWIRTLILWGSTEVINPQTLSRVELALHEPPPETKGAPELLIPAGTNVWMRSERPKLPTEIGVVAQTKSTTTTTTKNNPSPERDDEEDELNPPSDFVLVDSAKLARMGVGLDPLMVSSHFPNGYESALHNLR